MDKIILFLACFCLLHPASGQKSAFSADKDFNFVYINSVEMVNSPVDIHQYLDPFFGKDSLQGTSAFVVAVANELALKNIVWIDGHGHGTVLEVFVYHTDGTPPLREGYTAPESMISRQQKIKGPMVVVDMVDHATEKLVWTGWCALKSVKGATDAEKLRKAARSIISNYPKGDRSR